MPYPEPEPQFEQWLAAARKQDKEALGNILNHYRAELMSLATKKLGGELLPKADPADLVQDTFLEAQLSFARFIHLSEEATLQWLKRILKNNLADLNRRFRNTKRAVSQEQRLNTPHMQGLVDDEPTPRTAAAARELSTQVLHAMAQMPPEYEEVLRLREMDNLRFSEIAQRMNKPTADATRKLYDRASKLLVELLTRMRGSIA